MSVSRPANVTSVTATGSSAKAVDARLRNYLGVYNNDASNAVAINFGGTAAVASAGSITIPAAGYREWVGGEGRFVPSNQVNIISAGSSSPVTIVE